MCYNKWHSCYIHSDIPITSTIYNHAEEQFIKTLNEEEQIKGIPNKNNSRLRLLLGVSMLTKVTDDIRTFNEKAISADIKP